MARAALRHLDLPVARLEAPHANCACWSTTERTSSPSAHAASTGCAGTSTSSTRPGTRVLLPTRYVRIEGMVARVALEVARRVREISEQEKGLEREISAPVADLAPHLLALPGVGALGAAKIAAEVADVRRFKSKDAFARHNGTAPLPVWSGNRERHRLSRTGNRQLNAVIHRMAITQARCHEDAAVFL